MSNDAKKKVQAVHDQNQKVKETFAFFYMTIQTYKNMLYSIGLQGV